MPRVIGIDPGTITIDVVGVEDSHVFLERSLPTPAALASPASLLNLLEDAHRTSSVDLVAGPSGFGLPCVYARDATDDDLRLACLAPAGERGGLEGLGTLMRALRNAPMPVVFTPGVIHLPSVPPHRKVNRVDMGTAEKVAAVALALQEEADRRQANVDRVSFVMLELGGAFSAAVAVDRGEIVDGMGGTAGPLGLRAAGALDGEVAYLAGPLSKAALFSGGAATIAGSSDDGIELLVSPATAAARMARAAYFESAVKAVAALATSLSTVDAVLLSGRVAQIPALRDELTARLARVIAGCEVRTVRGFARTAKHAAQGAALIADGLSGGRAAALVRRLGLENASGTALDHLFVITKREARARLGLTTDA